MGLVRPTCAPFSSPSITRHITSAKSYPRDACSVRGRPRSNEGWQEVRFVGVKEIFSRDGGLVPRECRAVRAVAARGLYFDLGPVRRAGATLATIRFGAPAVVQ